MGVQMDIIGVADKSPTAAKWLRYQWGDELPHIFTENAAFIAGAGACHLHGRKCECSSTRPDLTTAGLPCPPFSKLRSINGTTSRTGLVSQHPAFSTVMGEFFDYLQARRPRGFWVEEVDNFGQTDLQGRSFLTTFCKKAAGMGYAVRALFLDQNVWVECPRSRVWIVGMGHEVGHSKAADWMVHQVQEAMKYRGLTVPTPVQAIVDPDCPMERHRRDIGQDFRWPQLDTDLSSHASKTYQIDNSMYI